MTDWGNGYYEVDKGMFNSMIIKNDKDICFTDDDIVRLGRGYKEEDRGIVEEFANYYELPIQE